MAYDSFSEYYDLLMSDAGTAERAAYYHSLIKSAGVDGGILLDAGCGTGTMSVEFSRAGYEVIGVDSSVGMLMKAREKAAAAGCDILLLNQDMTALDLYGTVDCAVSAMDCLNHLENIAAVEAAFAGISLFMRPGGAFVFDMNTVYKHEQVLAGNTFVYDKPPVYCVWQNGECENGRVEMSLDFFAGAEDGLYERSSEYFSETAYDTGDISLRLSKAGFEVRAVLDDMSGKDAHEKTERAVFLAVKR